MQVIKFIFLGLAFFICSYIGNLFSKKYTNRLAELKEMKNALNILKTKIRFTYEPIPEIFKQISRTSKRKYFTNF